jgi:neutral ceramidase
VVSVDGGMGSDLVKMRVLDAINVQLGEGVYTTDNLSISGTHTHSGPAGYLQYLLYQVTSLGYVDETFQAWVEGIASSVVMAHKNIQPAKVTIAQGKLYDSNINRSPTSYLLNPQEERDQYPDGDTDKNMMLLKFTSAATGKPLGVLNYFAVHATRYERFHCDLLVRHYCKALMVFGHMRSLHLDRVILSSLVLYPSIF